MSIQLPQTDFTRTIPVNVYDAKVFLGRIQSQIEILEMVNKTDEAKHWIALMDQAKALFGMPEILADQQRRIDSRIKNLFTKKTS